MEDVSITSITDGTWITGGDGVLHSPTSIASSAITPSKGARRVMYSSCRSASSICASARFSPARATSPAARAARAAARAARPSRALEAIEAVGRNDPLLGEAAIALELALAALRRHARARPLGQRRLALAAREIEARPGHACVELEQHVAGLHPIAPALRQRDDAPTLLRRELGASARLHRAGPGVRDRLLDTAALDRGHLHRHRIGGEDR